MFSTLSPSIESQNRRRVTFVCGLVAETLLLEAAMVLGASVTKKMAVTPKHYTVTWIPLSTPPEKLAPHPPREVARLFVPKLKPPGPVTPLGPPEQSVAHLETPKLRPTTSPVRVPETPLPAPSVSQPLASPKEVAAVHTVLFGGTAVPVTTKRPLDQVQTGGFGSPQGITGHALGDNQSNGPKLGSFGLPQGPGVGNGTSGAHGIQEVVASAGFGSGVGGPGYGRRGGGNGQQVSLGGFAQANQVMEAKEASLRVPSPADFHSVEILSKPSPIYTEEARRLEIQGEVVLSVVFQANAEVCVTGVVKSLGHGLDQAAEEAATQIRFKPAQRSGQPADFPATLRIQFRLANQSS